MEVNTVSNILGFFYNNIVKEFRTTYDYDKGADVTIVDIRTYGVRLYSAAGQLDNYPNKGSQVDIKA
jgi:hypothetical protein